ncbi:MAG: FecR family protein [Bacteroidales bacterium]|nr:FecR family protein [Bacteroidales bacterium]
MEKEKIIKHLKGLSSEIEVEVLLNWVNQSEENAALFNMIRSEFVFNNLPYKVIDKRVESRVISRVKGKTPFSKTILRVAAIIMIPLIVAIAGYQFLNMKKDPLLTQVDIKEKITPDQRQITTLYKVNPGVKGLVNLPDGSSVWLNSNSTLEAPDKFDTLARIVELNGEGYFIVKSDRDWPMYVKTKRGITVKVTGTEFNLLSYENDKELKFTLLSGQASLIRENTKEEISVKVMEEIVIPDKLNTEEKRGAARIKLNTGWKDGFLVFEDTPMSEVIKKMERWYGVSFTVSDSSIYSYYFTATFSSESITQILELLKITSNIGYSIKNRDVTLRFE